MMNYELLIANRELLIDYATILHFQFSIFFVIIKLIECVLERRAGR